ncbi:aryldialkylphosphatase [Microbacterium sp. 2FI]|uniref:phosphotriesterase family protein n=1 Tax=Microbacterium sp. 2FI TaxID=2502193 RepID=UPI0010F7064E|nr:aryldialkylphosphatase [Microbacterium sp. 2FI]
MAAFIQTVLGPLPPSAVGRILHHEHLGALVPGPWLSGGAPIGADETEYAQEDVIERAVGALATLAGYGIDTVVDLSPYGVVGRDESGDSVLLLQEISRRSGVHIVAGSSVYLEPFSPQWTHELTVTELTERFVRDVTVGIGTTGVRAGILGEQATGLDEITAHEEKCLRAAARAQVETGVALVTHTTHGTMAMEQVGILREESADLSRVVIGHMDIQPDLDTLVRVLDTGVGIAFDTIGKQHWDFVLEPLPAEPAEGEYAKRAYFRSDLARARNLVALTERGYASQLHLSEDLTGAEVYLNPETHGRWGYGYLAAVFLPLAIDEGLDPALVDQLLGANPRALLTQGTA